MVFGKKKEDINEGEEGIPEHVMVAIAEQFFKQYGEAFVNVINQRISERFKPIEEILEQHGRAIERLEATSNERLKDMVRSILEVQTENIADKAAERAISKMGVDKIKKLEEDINELRKTQMEIAETLENVAELMKVHESAIASHQRKIKELYEETVALKEGLSKAIEMFNEEVSKAVADATKAVREAITVDRSKIEAILGDVVTRVVNAKMREISEEFTEITDRYEEMSQNIGRIIDLAEGVEVLSAKLSDIEKSLQELRENLASVRTVDMQKSEEGDELEEIAEGAKEYQDRAEKGLDEDIIVD